MSYPNPKKKYGDKKVPLQLVPSSASASIAIGLKEGAEKYGAWNWRSNPVELMTYVGAIKRHLDAFVEGELQDPDGKGKTHLDGVMANAAILVDALSLGEGRYIDDRPPQPSPGALAILSVGSINNEPTQIT